MGLRGYFLKKVTASFVTWLLVLVMNFFALYLFSKKNPSSLPNMFMEYLDFVFVKRFGPSGVFTNVPTLDYLLSKSIYSIILLLLSVATAALLGVSLGTIASYFQGKKKDAALAVAVLLPATFPIWWLSLVIKAYLSPPFPARGWFSDRWIFHSPWSDVPAFVLDFLNHLILPFIVFVLALTGLFFLVSRNSLRDIYTEDFIVTAKAKGLSPLQIMFRHALRNALIPIFSGIALIPPILVLGVIMVETVFSRGGMGMILASSVLNTYTWEPIWPPTPMVQALFVLFATIVILLQLAVDLGFTILDPRIRVDGAGLRRLSKKSKRRRYSQPLHKRMAVFSRRLLKGHSGKFGLAVICFFALVGIIAPYLPLPRNKYNVLFSDLSLEPSQPPSFNHLLGTDGMRRDVLTLVLYAARASLLEGVGAVALALVIGCFMGLFSGYLHNHWAGYLLDRITDAFLVVPIIVLIVYFPGEPGALKWILAVGLTTWPIAAKLVRADVISAKERPFVEASKAVGAGRFHIMFRTLLPMCLSALASSILYVSITALSIQSCLDYLGFTRNLTSRIDPVLIAPYLSWGTMLSYGMDFVTFKQWWVLVPPAICISLLCLALIAIGNKMIELANPKLST